MQCNNKINIVHNIAYAQMPFSILYNINATRMRIQPQSAECNATITLTLCTTLLMIKKNAQMRFS